jgi:Flp pilus assembly pilin Flp
VHRRSDFAAKKVGHGWSAGLSLPLRGGEICMTQLFVWLQNRLDLRDEEGQTAVEYALVIGVVSIALVVLLSSGLADDFFQAFWDKVTSALG